MKIKNVLFSALAIIAMVSVVNALPADLEYDSEYNSSGDTNAVVGTYTGDMLAISDRQIEIWSIMAKSDLSTSVITISEGSTTGATTNYTVVADYDCGDGSILIQGESAPIYVGPRNTQLRVNLTSTAANSLVVGWKYR